MRKIAAVTVGIRLRPLAQSCTARRRSRDRPTTACLGAHFDAQSGHTFTEIEADSLPSPATPIRESRRPSSIHRRVQDFAVSTLPKPTRACARPLVIGDRFEIHAAALSATDARARGAHHGDELTLARWATLRRSMTKLRTALRCNRGILAHRQMGEEPWRVTVSGAPGLDNPEIFPHLAGFAARHDLPSAAACSSRFIRDTRTILRMAHSELAAALAALDVPILFTLPNGHRRQSDHPRPQYVAQRRTPSRRNLGTHDYFSAMSWSLAMVGNSSAGSSRRLL